MLSSMAFAQGKYGADSSKCVRNLSLYRDYYKQKSYDDAYKFWKIVYTICPASSERMYVDGANLVEYKLKKATTDEAKKAYVDSLKMVYDQRIANFGKEGYVLGRKGTDMLKYDQENIEEVYATLKKSIDLEGKGSGPGAIVSAMNASVLMEKKEKHDAAEVVAMFGTLSDILAANIAKYEGQKNGEYYLKAQEAVENIAGPYLNCDILVKMANDNYEKNKENADWMERTANLLDRKGCIDAPIFYTIAKTMHASNPSAVSAEKMGVMSLKNKKYQDAVNYFKQAIELAQDDKKMADYYIELAQAYSSMGSYSAARQNARKAAELRPGDGLPYIMIGDMIAGSSSACDFDDACKKKALYWLATDYYQRAKSVDPSMADKANAKIATYKPYYPTKEECFFLGIKEGDTVEIGCWIGESTTARF
ncbi:MAG: hypothetical protein CMP59_08340 [Flavobacteriales bacterium]|nr:hypothetical protein [Flavobacteriales bacterium]